MHQDIRIRNVTVELLRSGPSHNQLLSPLTLYLGICDEAEAGLVSLPFEHHRFLRRMGVLRYDAGNKASDKLPELREMGVEMAKVLGAVPRLPGALSADNGGRDTLVHLRLVLTAAELALLPFELSKVPLGPTQCAEGWLALQSRVPVVMTRRTRNVAARDFQWLKDPRVLFVSANPSLNETGDVPFDEHRSALLDAVRPFLFPGDERRQQRADQRRAQYGDRLTILTQPRIHELVAECREHRYTHVHVLAHGASDTSKGDQNDGLQLHPADGVISGERLASAITCMAEGRIHRPDVVTLATCNSGKAEAAVLTPGASIAHVLHQAGVPLVLASQFPLTKDGSVLVAREFYSGLLWGDHPWVLMHRVRMALHGTQDAGDHDWASLVVYEALELDAYKLDQGRYNQCHLAMQAAWLADGSSGGEVPDEDDDDGEDFAASLGAAAAATGHESDFGMMPVGSAGLDLRARALRRDGRLQVPHVADGRRVRAVIERLPVDSKFFGMRSLALRADGRLQHAIDRLHDVDHQRRRIDRDEEYVARVAESCRWMEDALDDYEAAVTGFLVKDGQGMNAPYRSLVALLRLRAVLGRSSPAGSRETALFWVESTLRELPADSEEHAWALACACELHLLRLLESDPRHRQAGHNDARDAATKLARLDRQGSLLARRWLLVQLGAFIAFWGDERFEAALEELGEARRGSFNTGVHNLVDTARAVRAILDKPDMRDRIGRPLPLLRDAPATPAPRAAASPDTRRPAPSEPAQPALLAAGGTAGAFIELDMLPARHGDSLWIEYGRASGERSRILVDCGPAGHYPVLEQRLRALPAGQRHIDLFILSHIDDDHIGAGLALLRDAASLGVTFGDVWFNGWRHLSDQLNAAQGEAFSALLERNGLPWNRQHGGHAVVRREDETPVFTLPSGMVLTLLSPTPQRLKALARSWQREVGDAAGTPEAAGRYLGRQPSTSEDVEQLADAPFESDDTAPNGSSIAVLAEFEGLSLLLGADAHAPVLQQAVERLCALRGVERLRLDAFKLPHHGSRNNLSNELLQSLDCEHFLVSTSGARFNHPDREAIARVIRHGQRSGRPATLWFNHRADEPLNAVWDKPALKARYGYAAVYPQDNESGLRFTLPRR